MKVLSSGRDAQGRVIFCASSSENGQFLPSAEQFPPVLRLSHRTAGYPAVLDERACGAYLLYGETGKEKECTASLLQAMMLPDKKYNEDFYNKIGL